MNIKPKLNKSENFVENNKINLSPLKNEKAQEKSNEKLFQNNIPAPKMDFYALGKVDNFPEISIKKYNHSFRCGSNSLLKRNFLSVNSPKFDSFKEKKTKKLVTIFHQDVENNNYLQPYNPLKSKHRYDIPNNSINQEMYNMAKKKIYIKEQQSNVNKGKQISKIDFLNKKKKLVDIKNNNISSSTESINSIRGKFFEKVKLFENPSNIKEKMIEEKENKCDKIIKEKFGRKKLLHSFSSNSFQPINPTNIKNEELKNINYHLDRNRYNIIRSRNWWKPE